jgi:hypothetical protein
VEIITMPLTELRRASASAVAEPSNPIIALALKAEAVLGYSRLRKRLGIEPGSLASTLNEIGIEPFRSQDVTRYKAEKAAKVEHQVLADYRRRARQELYFAIPPGTYVRATWRTVPLKDYDAEVPEYALSHALEIKERMPEAEFDVEELRVEKRYDPFLIVYCGRERFYIDVWDEPPFEKQHC